MRFSIKDIFSKCDKVCSIMQIWSHLLKKSLMKNFIFCAVLYGSSNLKLPTSRGRCFSEIDVSQKAISHYISYYNFHLKNIYKGVQFYNICRHTVWNLSKNWVRNMIGDWSLLIFVGRFLKNIRNSHRRCSVRKGVLRTYAKLTENICARVWDLRPATL